ncbi:hypothetical protein LCGC14_1530810 [marine sediment metagenome]|uniref:Uncharacterized protein n=1 Tax=marine sediment metagenome TaxID=412755 RepID=A0A0F9IW61_9ZZZZ
MAKIRITTKLIEDTAFRDAGITVVGVGEYNPTARTIEFFISGPTVPDAERVTAEVKAYKNNTIPIKETLRWKFTEVE